MLTRRGPVVERNLRHSTPVWRGIIIRELTAQPAVGEVLRDRYGNYCLQTALQVANQAQVTELVRAITPHLPTLRENVRAKVRAHLVAAAPAAVR